MLCKNKQLNVKIVFLFEILLAFNGLKTAAFTYGNFAVPSLFAMTRKGITLLVFILFCATGFSQRKSVKDSIYHVLIVGIHIEGQLPGGDLANRFGPSMSAGLPVLYKTGKNILFGVESNIFFGGNVKEHVMTNLMTPDNTITDINGNPAALRFNERGWSIYGMFGGIFNKLLGHNKNSGIMALAGLGYMQHKIVIYDVGHNVPQIHGNLIKGYDRLTGGLACNQFIGYMYISQNRISNFYFGLELQEAFTTGQRSYQYDLMGPDNKSRLDLLYGVRFGWLLPLYKKTPKEFYYY